MKVNPNPLLGVSQISRGLYRAHNFLQLQWAYEFKVLTYPERLNCFLKSSGDGSKAPWMARERCVQGRTIQRDPSEEMIYGPYLNPKIVHNPH